MIEWRCGISRSREHYTSFSAESPVRFVRFVKTLKAPALSSRGRFCYNARMSHRRSSAAPSFPPGKLVWATALLSLLAAIELGGGKYWFLLTLPLALWGSRRLLLPASRAAFPPVASRLPLGRIRLVQALDTSGRARFERGFDHFRRTLKVEGTRGAPPGESTRDWIAAGFATVFFTAGPPWPVFPRPVVVHPGRGFARDFSGQSENLAGLAIPTGPMVLAARAVAEGFADGADGYNPVFHEIAHYLDFHATVEDAPPMSLSALMVDSAADGIPAGSSAQDSDRWSRVIGAELSRVTRGRSLFDPRLATDEGELFALAVERFFETPEPLRDRCPDLYDLLCGFFHLDPAVLYHPPPAERGTV